MIRQLHEKKALYSQIKDQIKDPVLLLEPYIQLERVTLIAQVTYSYIIYDICHIYIYRDSQFPVSIAIELQIYNN